MTIAAKKGTRSCFYNREIFSAVKLTEATRLNQSTTNSQLHKLTVFEF